MPLHIAFQVLIFLFGIVFFLCDFFAVYHEMIHGVCLPCGRYDIRYNKAVLRKADSSNALL